MTEADKPSRQKKKRSSSSVLVFFIWPLPPQSSSPSKCLISALIPPQFCGSRVRPELLQEQEQTIFVFCRNRLNLATIGGHIGLTGKQQWCCTCYRKGYQMSATVNTVVTAAPAKKAAAPAAKAAAPQAPRFVMGPWPVKAQGGNSIRGYCYSVAKALTKSHPNGFTANEFASALASSASGSTYKQPSAGWGTAAKPNGNALAHANWFAHAKQGWLAPAPAKAQAPAPAKAQAPAPAKA